MIDKILFNLLLLDGNETNLLNDNNTIQNYRALVLELTKVKYNIRYCSNDNCPCHPEYAIKKLIEDDSLVNFLIENCYKDIVDDIKNLVYNYTPIVAKGIYER